MVQGRCKRCEVAYRWPGSWGKLREAYCPECGTKLSRTTGQYAGPWIYLERSAQLVSGLRLARERGGRDA